MKSIYPKLDKIKTIVAVLSYRSNKEQAAKFAAMLAQQLGKNLMIFQAVSARQLLAGQVPVGNAPFIMEDHVNLEGEKATVENELKQMRDKLRKEHAISSKVIVEIGFEAETLEQLLKNREGLLPVISAVDHNDWLDRLIGTSAQRVLGGPSPAAFVLPDLPYTLLPRHLVFLSEDGKSLSQEEMQFLDQLVKAMNSTLKIASLGESENPVDAINQLSNIYRISGIVLHADEQGFWGRLFNPDAAHQLLPDLKYPMLILNDPS